MESITFARTWTSTADTLVQVLRWVASQRPELNETRLRNPRHLFVTMTCDRYGKIG